MTDTTNPQAKLWELIKDTRFGMLTHRHSDGQLHSHPLTTQNKSVDEGATLYFFVPKDGDIVRHVATDASVNVAYANTDADSYVSVTGSASLLEDQAKKEELFNPMAKAWFPAGVTDPNLGLLAVRILDAEYWDVDDSKMVQLFKMAKA
ncbi:MAG: general stress protein, partial [Variovorax sp.]